MKRLVSIVIVVAMLFICSIPASVAQPEIENKLTQPLIERLSEMEYSDAVDVYLIIHDIDLDNEMERFANCYPEAYSTYMFAKESDTAYDLRELYYSNDCIDNDIDTHNDTVDDELLQYAIEKKRELLSEAYLSQNMGFAEKAVPAEKLLFVSCYSPMIIANLKKSEILDIAEYNEVAKMDLFINFEIVNCIETANGATRASYVRDHFGNKGSGVKIGMIEDAEPIKSENIFNTQSMHLHDHNNPSADTDKIEHATDVATVMVGKSVGIAPNASLYATGTSYALDFFASCEWLISKGVNIINMSASATHNGGIYDTACAWVDHIAIQHDIHFVAVAGNDGYENSGTGNSLVCSPGLAYNAITVGATDDGGSTSLSNDTLAGFSSYVENISYDSVPEKPNLVAPGVGISINGRTQAGTSFSAPQVAGVIAQLCSFDSTLKTKQTLVGAMIAAGTIIKIDDGDPHAIPGLDFISSVRIDGNTQISDKEGVGVLNAEKIRQVAANGRYWRYTINQTSFPFTQNVYISSTNNSLIRIAIFWLKRNSLSSSHNEANGLSGESFTNLDLRVKAPNGTVIQTSTTTYSNYEVVQFVPTQTGVYQIIIVRNGTSTSTKEYVGIAVW